MKLQLPQQMAVLFLCSNFQDGDNVVDPQDMTYATVRKSRDKKST